MQCVATKRGSVEPIKWIHWCCRCLFRGLAGRGLILLILCLTSVGAAEEKPVGKGVAADRDKHWAFQPVKQPSLPEVENEEWIENGIDAFVLDRLERNGLTPSPEADRRTLLRRLSFDLVGLPPNPHQIDAFLGDDSPEAYRRLVDRLLASPRYGERWGRHWLDVARYADTKGAVFQEEDRYPFAYTYRDYVIEAFNRDLPFDRFIKEQLAADKLKLGEEPTELAALGFLTVGRRFLNDKHEIIDDRIDVTTRGFMGLTVVCARCHDHKYDPIPTEDYYSLYGVFDSSEEPESYPLLKEPGATPGYERYKAGLEKRRAKLDEFKRATRDQIQNEVRAQVGQYLVQVAAKEYSGKALKPAEVGKLRGRMINEWGRYLKTETGPDHPIFGLWHRFASLDAQAFPRDAKGLIERVNGAVNPLIQEAFAELSVESMNDVARAYGKLLRETHQAWQTFKKESEKNDQGPPAQFEEPAKEAVRQILYGAGSPTRFNAEKAADFYKRAERDKQRKLKRKIEEWKVSSPNAPPRAMVLKDRPEPHTPHVFKRGNPKQKGKAVPRRFLKVLTDGERKPFSKTDSGRLELAEAITSRQNPLTARVLVNRVWMHHFGEPLVPGPSDFGTRSKPPSHPRLLDYLAAYFMEHDWSLKALHRLILHSNTYRQSSTFRAKASEKDPENRLLWRMNRQRLELEALRDAILSVADRLNRKMGGRPVSIHEPPYSRRRSVYAFIERSGYDRNFPSLFRIFDLASPDATAPKRPRTVVPQQGLFLMNWPFVINQAKAFAHRPELVKAESKQKRIKRMYELAYGRLPDQWELRKTLAFLNSVQRKGAGNGDKPGAWAQFAQALMISNEFLYID